MPFESFESDKPLGKQAKQVYKRYLDKLADEGITTKKQLLTQRRKVITAIKKLYPEDDDKARHHKRKALSAIFWVLHGHKMLETKSNIYYKLFKRNIQNYGKEQAVVATEEENTPTVE
jgi:hypothetical protein